jgi:hypothetical protein
MTKAMWIGLVLVFACGACGKSAEDQAKEDMAKKAAAEKAAEPPPAPTPAEKPATPPPTEAAKPAEKPAEPEPTTPAEIDKAFKQAMIDGRDKDVLKYCDMLKLDDKSNPQSLMGCTLAACRTNDADTAKKYSAGLNNSKDGKALLLQAKKVCLATKVAI